MSLDWFPKDLSLRKILTSIADDKEGQLDRFQRLQRYATVKNAQFGPAPEAGAVAQVVSHIYVTDMHCEML